MNRVSSNARTSLALDLPGRSALAFFFRFVHGKNFCLKPTVN